MTLPEFVEYDDVNVSDVVLVFLTRNSDDLTLSELHLINSGYVRQDDKGRLLTDSGCYLKSPEKDPRKRTLMRTARAVETYAVGDRLNYSHPLWGVVPVTVERVQDKNGKPRYDIVDEQGNHYSFAHPDDLERPPVAEEPGSADQVDKLKARIAELEAELSQAPDLDAFKEAWGDVKTTLKDLFGGKR